ncbi:hypothetical protein D9615_010442 [Tricholomella constricta]|uniref:RFTS domain-containing protein n=1 Tax=Tricholomella constricta TaxID=117010 RepID=A0A8H5GQB4_9AGAR|nr:hypothetical protein D9615_010442 [Tricholomella constricta]
MMHLAYRTPNDRSVSTYIPTAAFYVDRGGDLENVHLLLAGEDPLLGEDADADQDDSKPIRVLTDFCGFEAAGFAFPYVANEEDEGQEDEDGGGDGEKYVRLGAILRCTFDCTQANDPVYIETQFAWYILKAPAPSYAPYFQHFFTPWRIAQMVVSTALQAILEIQGTVNEYDDPEKLKASPLIRHILRKATPASTSRPTR